MKSRQYVSKVSIQSLVFRPGGDGFAVELVVFDDYMCGNPAYYTKPSRRNADT